MASALAGGLVAALLAIQMPASGTPPAPADAEVIGRIRNVGFAGVDDPDDLLGYGWITAELKVLRVLRGRLPSRRIVIRYLAHTYRSEATPVRLRLRADPDGTYRVCAGSVGGGGTCGWPG